MMDLNLVVIAGRLSAPAELSISDDGDCTAHLLVAVRSEAPVKRLDLLPVVWWDPPGEHLDSLPDVGGRVWVSGAIQRRYWDGLNGRRSRLEIVALHVTPYPIVSSSPTAGDTAEAP